MMGMYGDMWEEMNRLQRDLDQLFRPAGSTAIRAMSGRSFPVINVGSTPEAVEVLALAPGLAPADLEVTVTRGLLVISGERKSDLPAGDGEGVTVYAQERFAGGFRRVISLPDDVDAQKVRASCKDGLLHIRVQRQEAARPRRIDVH